MELFKHNAKTYESVKKLYDKGIKKFAIVQATGTGKSALAVKYIKDYFLHKKVLYLAPRNSILDSFQNNYKFEEIEVVYKTYSGFYYDANDVYDLVILDELHRTGAEKWNKEINKIFQDDIFIVGLTATPKRHLDKNRDMAKILFGNNIVHGPTLSEAIEMGILAKFVYITALFKREEIIDECVRKSPKNSKLYERSLKLNIQVPTIKEIFYKHVKGLDSNQKWLVFCPTVKSISEITNKIIDSFDFLDNKSFYSVNSNESDKYNYKNIKKFKECKKNAFLFSVDMLNEGVHIDDITGLIMLRQTESANVFLQQLGRGLSAAGKNKMIYVFDFVGNHTNLVKHHDMGEEFLKDGARINKGVSYMSNDIIVYDYTENLVNLMDKINYALFNDWTKEEDRLLKEVYFQVSKKELINYFSGKTIYSINKRARELGIVKKREEKIYEFIRNKEVEKFHDVLTQEDIRTLLSLYALQGKNIPELNHCSKEAIDEFLKLHATSKPCSWTKEQQQQLIDNYNMDGALYARNSRGHTSYYNIIRLIELNVIIYEEYTQSELLAKIKGDKSMINRI